MSKTGKQKLTIAILLAFIVAGALYLKRWLYVRKCNEFIGSNIKYDYYICHKVLEGEYPTNWAVIFGGLLILLLIGGLIWFALWLPFGVTQTAREIKRNMRK